MIGAAGETQRFEPGANEPGVYESHDGGATFTEVWNGAKPDAGISFGITDLGLDPLNPDTVYAAGFDAGVWRRAAGAAATAFQQVFAPQFDQGGNLNAGIDRAMFALTVKNGEDADLPDRRHGRRRRADRSVRGQLLADGRRQPRGGCAARLAGVDDPDGRGVRAARSRDAHVPRVVHRRVAVPDLA